MTQTKSNSSLLKAAELIGLEPNALDGVGITLQTLGADDILFRLGDAYAQAIFFLFQGKIIARYANDDVIHIDARAWLGLVNYLDGSPYLATIAAHRKARVIRIATTGPGDLEARASALFHLLNAVLATRMRQTAPTHSTSAWGNRLALPVRLAMHAPLAVCTCELTLREAFNTMCTRKIGSLGVIGADGRLTGLLTYASLSEALLREGVCGSDPVCIGAEKNVQVLGSDEPLWRAEEIQRQQGTKYVVVVEDDKPVGMVSRADILKRTLSAAYQSSLQAKAGEAGAYTKLARLNRKMVEVARQARDKNHRISVAVRIISNTHLAIQRRCVELTLMEMEKLGKGPAPADFALIIMGSGGRGEMLLNPDQDNGIIIANVPKGKQNNVEAWFSKFTRRVNKHLDEIGYRLCSGDIMARNPMFHKYLSDWRRQISHIAEKPTPKAARWANIVLDFSTLYGSDALTQHLRKHVLAELREKPRLLKLMVEDDAYGRAPLGWFKRLITEKDAKHKGKIDLKRNGLRLVADGARIFALDAGITNCNTSDRLRALARQGVLDTAFANSVNAAYEGLLDLLVAHQISCADDDPGQDKFVRLKSLSPYAQETLRLAMVEIKNFQEHLQVKYDTLTF
ncbi:MAG: CBS domain-containing protein [Gammaproteobacteria bacterium]|nr:CBS domain-containing protein [Gammaproteobacteria bacterium]